MFELGVCYRNINRADRAAADGLAALGSATVHEAMGRVGLLKPYMRPIYPGQQVSGTAVTVLAYGTTGFLYFEQPGNPDLTWADALWYCLVTLTTVGYGDVYPVTPLGRFFSAIIAIAGIGVVALPAGVFASAFSDELRERRERGPTE